MPELPEVENVRRTLLKKIINKKIKQVDIYYQNIIVEPDIDTFKNNLINQQFIDIKRKGKWLLFELNDYYLLSHLRMEGKYNLKNVKDTIEKHEHVNFIFDDSTCLRYKDTRKFGRMYLLSKVDIFKRKPLNELGLEPWDSNLNIKYLKNTYLNKTNPIKTVILDQKIITGIGNIYADEILFLSNINPLTRACDLDNKQLEKIIKNTRKVLEEAIELGGTTIRTYESSEGVHGRFQQKLFVHNQNNQKCKICNGSIIKIQVNGRGTYYCPKCQK